MHQKQKVLKCAPNEIMRPAQYAKTADEKTCLKPIGRGALFHSERTLTLFVASLYRTPLEIRSKHV